MKFLAALVVLAASSLAAHAQFAVYAMGSAGKLSGYPVATFSGSTATIQNNGSLWAYGGAVGIYDNFLRLGPIKLGGDIRGFAQTSSASNNTSTNANKLRGGLIGLRLAGSAPLIPFKPYIQAEIGGGSSNFGLNTTNTGGLIYQVQGGADFTIFPHLDVRAEYGVGQFVNVGGISTTNSSYTLQQLGAGAVLRF